MKVGDWKLRRASTGIELFNLTRPSGERVNLAARYPEKTASLTVLLDKYPDGQ